MNFRKTFVLLLVLIALGAYVYLVELPRQQEEAERKKLFTFNQDAVVEVTLTYPDEEIHLQKNGDKWQITQPIEADADQTVVNNLVRAVADTEITRTLDEPQEDLATYGLDEPVVTVHLTLKDGTTLPQITIGKDTPVGFSVYVKREGNSAVLLTPQSFRLGMTKDVKDLRDKTILAFQTDEVKKIEIQKTANSSEPIVLSKADSGWTLESPLDSKADDAEVRTFLSSLRSMRAQDFIEQPALELKEFGLAPPQIAVSLTLDKDSAQQTILMGEEKTSDSETTQRYVKRGERDTLFLVGDWVYGDLNKTVNDFRDKTVARFDQGRVARVEVSRKDGETFTLSRESDQKWTTDPTHEGALNETAISQFVTDLHELRGFEIAADNPTDLSTYGLQEPTLTIRAFTDTGDTLATVLVGQADEEGTKKAFALSEDGNTVFVLRDYVFERLNKKAADFWEKPAEEDKQSESSAD